MDSLQLSLPARFTRAALASACIAGFLASSFAPLLAQQPMADGDARRLDVLIVLFTHSFSQALTREQVERVHEEVLEFVDFYRTAAGGAVDFRISLLQIDRQLALAEVSEVAPGRYYLAREDIADELAALGMLDYEFDEVIALYAWNNANAEGAALAYGGGAVGPDGNFLTDAGYNSIGVFAWDAGRISQIMIHEVLHNIDDMFSMSGMPDAFLNSDEMSRNMETLLAERPGAFRPQYDDDEMLVYAERELANRATYPWAMQLIYYAWMLQRTPRDDWMKLEYGRTAAASSERGPRPLYDRIFLSRANDDVYLPAFSRGARTAAADVAGGGQATLERRTYQHTDFDGGVLFEGNYLAGWLGLPGAADRVEVTLGGATAEIVPLGMGDVMAPARVVTYAGETEGGDEALVVELREARLGGNGPRVEGASLSGLEFEEREPGYFVARLVEQETGARRIALEAEAPGIVFVSRSVELERRYPWSIAAAGQIVAGLGTPFDLTVRIAQDRGVSGARVTATVAEREVALEELADGRYSVALDEELAPGLDTIRVRAELAADSGTEVLERAIPIFVEPRGWIEVPTRIGGAADAAITLEARVRDRMGRVVKGANLAIAVVVGPHVVMMTERDGDSGVYKVNFSAPPGMHRIYVVGLEGNFERRVIVLQVE
jgi:hypothetical protein